MRHHRRSEDADGDVERLRVRHDRRGWEQEAPRDAGQLRPAEEDLEAEADPDHGDQGDDERLDVAEAAVLQIEHEKNVKRVQAHSPDQGDPEQQLQRQRGADDLGQVTRGDGHLAQHPEPERDGTAEVVAARLRQVAAGGHTQLDGEALEQHRHQVR